MARTLDDITTRQDEIAPRFEDYEPQSGDRRAPRPLESLRNADTDAAVARAVREARQASYGWGTLANPLGTTGEDARWRYGAPDDAV